MAAESRTGTNGYNNHNHNGTCNRKTQGTTATGRAQIPVPGGCTGVDGGINFLSGSTSHRRHTTPIPAG